MRLGDYLTGAFANTSSVFSCSRAKQFLYPVTPFESPNRSPILLEVGFGSPQNSSYNRNRLHEVNPVTLCQLSDLKYLGDTILAQSHCETYLKYLGDG